MSKRKLTPFRKKYLKLRISDFRRETKLKCIEYKGGKCEICGYDKCPASLAFHHLDPSQKDFGISSSGFSRSFEKCKPELDKCILVCMNCHGEIHYKEYQDSRLQRIEEINSEKRKLGKSVNKNCAYCKKEIVVFASQLKERNFCSRNCKCLFIRNDGWITDEELLKLKETLTVKEISLKLNKSIKQIYNRLELIKSDNKKTQTKSIEKQKNFSYLHIHHPRIAQVRELSKKIDFSKFGWITKVSKEIGTSRVAQKNWS
jgi:endogenous inhibitor of DNA gyrase (YacG/DUF329 family)